MTSKPVVVLVRPQLGENIGTTARAMLNFGLTELRLVAPRDGWPNPDAGPAASGADAVLTDAKTFETTAEAVADCAHVYATTVRKRGMTKQVVTPETAARDSHARKGRTAILFGPEASGLANDDVLLAQEILTVPVNPDFSSLNLAQAVILCAYEWSRQIDLADDMFDPLEAAPQKDVDGLVGQLSDALEKGGYYRTENRSASAKATVRNLFTRPGYTAQEIRTLRGIVSTLSN